MNPTTVDEAQRLLSELGPTCEHRNAREELTCSAEATWLLRVSCGDSAFFCEGHREAMENLNRGEALYCAGHGGRRVRYDWIAI